MSEERGALPLVLAGVLIALLLIAVARLGGGSGADQRLVRQFAARPTDPAAPGPPPVALPRVELPALPPEIQRTVVDLRDRLAGGQPVPPLTPVATGPRARVEVREVRRSGDRVHVTGAVRNDTTEPLDLPPGAFSFHDSAGEIYTTGQSAAVTLPPGQSTDFDLSVPLPPGRGLTLVLNLPPDPPLSQVLFVEVAP